MSGNKAGAAKRTQKLLEQNPNYFKDLSAKSHLKPHKNRPFQVDPELARSAGKKGYEAAKKKDPNFNFTNSERARAASAKAAEARRKKKAA